MDKEYLDWVIEMCSSILDGTADAFHPQLPPVYGNIICWKVELGKSAILYQDETVFDKKS